MSLVDAEPAAARAQSSFFDQVEERLGALSRVIAMACVSGMLFIAGVTLVDVAMRLIANEPIPAMNEIVQ
ncbi:MAG: hypothetical protein ACREFQ_20555, partial [Stellaceae bacterium]